MLEIPVHSMWVIDAFTWNPQQGIQMLNDKQLEDLSYEIDDFLVKCSNKYKVGTLSLSAVTLARLIRAVEIYGDRQDFDAIMLSAMDSRREQPTIQ